MQHRPIRLLPSLLLAACIAGCATQADPYQRPLAEPPAQWSVRAAEEGWPEPQWWSAFGSPELDALIEQAQAANHDLRTAAARVEQARANSVLAASGQSPQVGLAGGGNRSKDADKSAANNFNAAGQVAYEADLWGRLHDTAASGQALLVASEFDRDAVRLQLTADVANAYFTLLSFNDRLQQAPDPQGSLRALALPPTRGGVPAQLVERRPDIRRAEASLQSANADVGAARAAVLPNLTLHAAGGSAGGVLSSILGSGGGFYTLAFALAGTIFDGGALRSRVDLAQAQKVERVEGYLQTVGVSFQEVEDALTGIEQFASEEDLLQAAARSAREAYRLTDIRYRAGGESFFNVLDAQRTQLGAESAIDPVRLARFTATTGLYRALGGGWQDRSGVVAEGSAQAR